MVGEFRTGLSFIKTFSFNKIKAKLWIKTYHHATKWWIEWTFRSSSVHSRIFRCESQHLVNKGRRGHTFLFLIGGRNPACILSKRLRNATDKSHLGPFWKPPSKFYYSGILSEHCPTKHFLEGIQRQCHFLFVFLI